MRTAKILLALAVVAMIASNALAQEKQKRRGKKGAVKLTQVTQVALRLEKLQESLKKIDLTEEQQGKLKELHTTLQPKMQKVVEKVTEIVGAEKMKEAGEVGKKAKEGGKSSRQVAAAVEAAMKLSDEQKEKLTKVGKEMSGIQREIMKKVNGMLTDEQKEKLKALMAPQRKGGKTKKDK